MTLVWEASILLLTAIACIIFGTGYKMPKVRKFSIYKIFRPLPNHRNNVASKDTNSLHNQHCFKGKGGKSINVSIKYPSCNILCTMLWVCEHTLYPFADKRLKVRLLNKRFCK